MSRKSLPVITITFIMVLVLATAGVAYGLWSEELVIDGVVETGEVDVAFSGPYAFEYVRDMNNRITIEPEVKDYAAECYARAYDYDPGSDGMEGIDINVTGAYPGYICLVYFDIHSLGSVPVHVTQPYSVDAPEWVQMHACFPNWVQLHNGDSVWGYFWIEFDNFDGVNELDEYTFHFDVDAWQWNEAPAVGTRTVDYGCELPEGVELPEGYLQ